METVKLFEKRYRRYPLLKLQGYNHNNEMPLKTFIENFFKDYNRRYDTFKVKRNILHSSIVYGGRNRSLQDIFGLCRYYYKGCSFEQVLRAVFDVISEDKNKFYALFCPNVMRYVINCEDYSYHSGIRNTSQTRLNNIEGYVISDLWRELGYTDNQL